MSEIVLNQENHDLALPLASGKRSIG